MGRNEVNLLILILSVLASEVLRAKTIYFGGSPETVPVAYGTTTILRFEEPVKTISNARDFIIKPVNQESPDYAVLSVEPRVMSGKSDTVFILAGGDVARLKLSVVPMQAHIKLESMYDVKSQKALIESRVDATPFVGRLELMTAMIRGDQVTGYDLSTPGLDLSTGSDSTHVALVRVYSGDEFKGYVYEIKNLSTRKSFDLDIRKLQFGRPNQAILAYSDLDVLERSGSGKDKTRLLVVTKPASGYRDAVLPIRMTRKADKAAGGHDE